MARAFAAGDLAQPANSNSASATPSVALTLGSPTTDGNLVVAYIKSTTDLFSASDAAFDMIAKDHQSTGTRIFARVATAGETSWTFTTDVGGNPNWAWWVEEWSNAEVPVGLVATGGLTQPSPGTTLTTGTTTAAPATYPYVLAVACWSLSIGGTTGTFPTETAVSNGFAYAGSVAFGTGSAPLDQTLYVARYFGTLNETGPWESTITLSGSIAGTTGAGAIAALLAVEPVMSEPAQVLVP